MRWHWKSYWQAPSFRRLILAVAISFLLHWVFIKEFRIDLPSWETETHTIEARLVLPKLKKAAEPAAAPLAAPLKPQVKPLADPKPNIEPPAPIPPPAPAINQAAPQPLPPVEDLPIMPEEPMPAEAAVIETPTDIETQADDTEVMINQDAYKYVETEFDVRTDPSAKVDSRPEGRAKIVYQLLPNGEQYRLESLIEPIGLAAMIIPDLLQTSEGYMSSMGLQPIRYLYQFGDKKDKTYRASMDWEKAKLQLQTSKATKEVPLLPGTQDMLSFMYQFMFISPPQNMQLTITNGKKLDSYQYFFAGEEIIDTKNGKLRTVHIYRDNDDGDERSELWLAVDYQYVPVKIRKTEPENKVYELLATSIKTELPPEPQP